MPWFTVDDKLHDHRKARVAGKAAMGVWVLAGSWARDNRTDGFIPEGVITHWGTRNDAARLVSAGLWCAVERAGEPGWIFHDWFEFQPSTAIMDAWRAKESEAGTRGNHRRWHKNRGVSDPHCEYCLGVPDEVPDEDPRLGSQSGSHRPVPTPIPSSSSYEELHVGGAEIAPVRDDIDRLCEHLAIRIEGNTGKRPTITPKWRTDARLLLDRDNRNADEAHRLIDWATSNDFWLANILSMPKFREKYDQLRLQASRNGTSRHDIDWDTAFARAAARDDAEGDT